MASAQARTASTAEFDIQREFRDVKAGIDALRNEINGWKDVFNTQLTKLNLMMEQTLAKLADHEARLTNLERRTDRSDIRRETVGECAKFAWFAAKFLLGAGIVVGGALGTAQAWKLIFPGS